MGDSPDPPKPPKDYVAEKDAFAKSEYEKRLAQANDYNNMVNNWNNQISSYGSSLSGLQTNIGGLKLTDDERFDPYLGDINSKLNQLYGTTFSASKPYFESTVMSPWGAVTVGIPTLNNADTQLKDNFISQFSSLRDQLNALKQQRYGEEQKINSFSSQLYGNLGGLSSRANNANISNLDLLNQLRTDYDTMHASLDSFQSPILGDYNNPMLGSINSMFGSTDSRLKQLMTDRTAELDRIKSYEQSVLDRAGGFSNTLKNMTIADESGMKSLRQQLDDYLREVNRFSTPINPGKDFDLSQETGELNAVRDQLNRMFSERDQEVAKVKAFEDQLNNAAMGIGSAARTSSMYNLGSLNDLQAQIDLARQKESGFSSILPANFSLANNQLSSAEQLISQLISQRGTALDQIKNRFNSKAGGWDNIADYDETGINSAMNSIYGFQNQLTPFQGADAEALRGDISGRMNDMQDKLSSLNEKRADLERQAQALLQTIKSKSFTDQNGITSSMSEAESLQSQVQLYKAMQAMDEIDGMMSKLNSEKSRLEKDSANVTAQTALEASNPLGGTSSITDLMNRISPEQYAQLMAMSKKVQNGEMTADEYNAFLKSLGMGV